MTRAELLQLAETIVCNDREQQYGKPEDNFGCIARLWSEYLGTALGDKDVAVMMALLKIARIKSGQMKDDNWIDAIGYLACGGELAAKGITKNILITGGI